MSSIHTVSKSVALAEQALGRGSREAAFEYLAEAIQDSLSLAASAGAGPDRGRFSEAAEELLSTLEALLGGPSEFQVRDRPSVRLEDIAGMDDVKRKLREMVILPVQRPEIADIYGLRAGGGILLYGPPGNGKTALAKAVAGELEADFFYATGADIRSKWHGESEQNLRRLIRDARACKVAILFLDDVDGLLPHRGSEAGADNRLVTQFLQEIGGFAESGNVLLLLGATNNPWDLDPAVLRTCRFDHKIFVGLPDLAAREFLLRQRMGRAPLGREMDIGAFAMQLEGYTGSDLGAIVDDAKRVAAGRLAAGGTGEIGWSDLDAALRTVPPSANRQLMARYEEYARTSHDGTR